MEEKPLVSVIIPTYNRPDYLVQTIKSVVGQTYSNIEIIVVDDGTSGNDNFLICEKFEKVSYIKIENSGGPAKPRNVGIKEAKGEFIAFVDDDDIWLPEKIEKQISILLSNLEFGLVHCPCQIIDEKGKETGQIIGRPGSPDVKHGDVKMRMMGNWTLMMPTPLIRASVLKKVGFFNEQIPPALEDVEFWTRCSFYTKFYYIDEPLVKYRQHTGNISRERNKYVDMPLYLMRILGEVLRLNIINKEQYKNLMNNLCLSQLKYTNTNPKRTLRNLYIIDSFWFINFRNVKLLIKKIIL